MVGTGLEAGPHVVLEHARQPVHGQGKQLQQKPKSPADSYKSVKAAHFTMCRQVPTARKEINAARGGSVGPARETVPRESISLHYITQSQLGTVQLILQPSDARQTYHT